MSGRGHLLVAGFRYEITDVGLTAGRVRITARRNGPVPKLVNEPVAVFGDDGRGVCQGTGHEEGGGLNCPAAEPGQMAEVTIDLRIEGVR